MARTRGGFAVSDLGGRALKARKIVALLADDVRLDQSDVLDLGAGSGLLAQYLQTRARSVIAADRDTGAFVPKDIEIRAIDGTELPFEAERFDLVIFNHVIEHVGPLVDQRAALAEITRVLRPGGVLYLAAPNRYALIEPHYRLPFLSWLPQSLADRYVAAAERNDWYDCTPLSLRDLRRLARDAGFAVRDATSDAFYALLRIERSDHGWARTLERAPRWLVDTARPAMPTFVLICRKPSSQTPTRS